MAASGTGDAHAREIAAGLVAAVRGAIAARDATVRAPAAPSGTSANMKPRLAWAAAADIADLLQLPGLMALLIACAAVPPAPSRHVGRALDRLARLADEAEASGDVRAFARADAELAALAATPGFGEDAALAVEDTAVASVSAAVPELVAPEPPGESDEGVRALGALLADFAIDDPAAIAHAMVALPVAAGVRAALEWIAADAGGRLQVEVQDAALTLIARATHEPGLGAAGAVLGLTGGALLPEPDGRWALRVPLHSARPAFLLARQGELSLALPWHAVARLRITDEASRGAMTEPSLAPWSALARARGERPAALLSLGLSRAWLHLDHIVWRVFAHPEPAEAIDLVPGGRLVVRTEEGEEFRVVDIEQALAGVPPLHTPPPSARIDLAAVPAAPVAPAPPKPEAALLRAPIALVREPAPVALVPEPEPITIVPEPAPVAEAPVAVAALADAPAPPIVLGPEFVRPLDVPAVREPAPAAAVAPTARPEPASEPVAKASPVPAVRRALVVDDSLVTRMELGRVLERRGWEVEWMETAADMWSALPEGGWSIVFVDVSLPDARGRAHLRALASQQRVAHPRFHLVALTRDEADERVVLDVGIVRMLRKPFAPGTVERMVRELSGARA